MSSKHVVWVVMAVLAVSCTPFLVKADDLFPPTLWNRGDPLSTSAQWDFLTAFPRPPDGATVPQFIGNAGGIPSFLPINAQWSAFENGSWIAGALPGGELVIDLPNWIDTMPIKLLRIQMTYQNPQNPFLPQLQVAGIQAVDANDPNPIEFLSAVVIDAPIPGSTNGLWQRVEDWTILPNPDRERITILLPPDTPLTQLVIDTISVPEPSTLAMAAAGLLGLAACRRRKAA